MTTFIGSLAIVHCPPPQAQAAPPLAASDRLVLGGEAGEILEGEAGEQTGQERP